MSDSFVFGIIAGVLFFYSFTGGWHAFANWRSRRTLAKVRTLSEVCPCEGCAAMWNAHKPIVTLRGEFKWRGAQEGQVITMTGNVKPLTLHQMTVRLYKAGFFHHREEQLAMTIMRALDAALQAKLGEDKNELLH